MFLVFFITREDGYMDAWDILYQQRHPILSFKVSDTSLNTVKVQNDGFMVAVGSNDGNVSMLELSGSLSVCNRYVIGLTTTFGNWTFQNRKGCYI